MLLYQDEEEQELSFIVTSSPICDPMYTPFSHWAVNYNLHPSSVIHQFSLHLQQVVYSSSVDIRPEWVVKEQIPFTSLLKLNYQVSEPEDLKFCGKLQYYDKSFDRVTPRLEKPLQATKKTFRNVTTSDDPVIRYPPDPWLLASKISHGCETESARSQKRLLPAPEQRIYF